MCIWQQHPFVQQPHEIARGFVSFVPCAVVVAMFRSPSRSAV
jgi:hypothetical protein